MKLLTFSIDMQHKYQIVTVSPRSSRKLIQNFDTTGDRKNIKEIKKKYNNNDATIVVVKKPMQENPKMPFRKKSQNILVCIKIHPFQPVFNYKLLDLLFNNGQ